MKLSNILPDIETLLRINNYQNNCIYNNNNSLNPSLINNNNNENKKYEISNGGIGSNYVSNQNQNLSIIQNRETQELIKKEMNQYSNQGNISNETKTANISFLEKNSKKNKDLLQYVLINNKKKDKKIEIKYKEIKEKYKEIEKDFLRAKYKRNNTDVKLMNSAIESINYKDEFEKLEKQLKTPIKQQEIMGSDKISQLHQKIREKANNNENEIENTKNSLKDMVNKKNNYNNVFQLVNEIPKIQKILYDSEYQSNSIKNKIYDIRDDQTRIKSKNKEVNVHININDKVNKINQILNQKENNLNNIREKYVKKDEIQDNINCLLISYLIY